MSNKAKKTNIVNIRVTNEEKLNWELFAHACGTNTSGLARYFETGEKTKELLTIAICSAARQLRVVCVALD